MKGVPVGEAEQVRGKTAVLRCDLLLAAALNFIVLTSIAIGLYPGSNNINSHTHGYSFTTNFFSDLGATRVYSHHLNVASAVLFMLALAGVGLSIAGYSTCRFRSRTTSFCSCARTRQRRSSIRRLKRRAKPAVTSSSRGTARPRLFTWIVSGASISLCRSLNLLPIINISSLALA